MTDHRRIAGEFFNAAYDQLQKAGCPEDYFSLLNETGFERKGAFFGKWGSETGVFLQITTVNDAHHPMVLTFGLRHGKRSIWHRLKDMWAVWRGDDSVYEVGLDPDDIRKLKDLARV